MPYHINIYSILDFGWGFSFEDIKTRDAWWDIVRADLAKGIQTSLETTPRQNTKGKVQPAEVEEFRAWWADRGHPIPPLDTPDETGIAFRVDDDLAQEFRLRWT